MIKNGAFTLEGEGATMPRPLPPVDEIHQIMLSALDALRATRTKDGKVRVIHNGGEHLSGRVGGSHPTAAFVHQSVPIKSVLAADQLGLGLNRITSAVGVFFAGSPVATVCPSLSTVTRSPISRITSRRCGM